jgi:uncharacterized membrane protein
MPAHRGAGPERRQQSALLIAAAAGAATGGLLGALGPWALVPLVGWDVAALTYLAWTWGAVWHLDAEHTARQAVRKDPGRAAADGLLLSASVMSLLAVGLVLVEAGNSSGAAKSLQAALSLASVVLSWSVVHTVFTMRYARLYYTGSDGGVEFHQDAQSSSAPSVIRNTR